MVSASAIRRMTESFSPTVNAMTRIVYKNSAWHRRNGLFAPCPDFEQFEAGNSSHRRKVTIEDVKEVIQEANDKIMKSDLAKKIMEAKNVSKNPAYNAINEAKPFLKVVDGGFVKWIY